MIQTQQQRAVTLTSVVVVEALLGVSALIGSLLGILTAQPYLVGLVFCPVYLAVAWGLGHLQAWFLGWLIAAVRPILNLRALLQATGVAVVLGMAVAAFLVYALLRNEVRAWLGIDAESGR